MYFWGGNTVFFLKKNSLRLIYFEALNKVNASQPWLQLPRSLHHF